MKKVFIIFFLLWKTNLYSQVKYTFEGDHKEFKIEVSNILLLLNASEHEFNNLLDELDYKASGVNETGCMQYWTGFYGEPPRLMQIVMKCKENNIVIITWTDYSGNKMNGLKRELAEYFFQTRREGLKGSEYRFHNRDGNYTFVLNAELKTEEPFMYEIAASKKK